MTKNTIVLIVLIALAGAGAFYFFGNPITDEIGKINISMSASPKDLKLTDRSFYKIYYPDKYEKTSVKKIVLVIQPGDEYMGIVSQWKQQSDKHDFALAVIPNWNYDLITQFNIDARQNLEVNKIYYTGFSGGGYASCNKGLDNQKYVDGIIPMGAYCWDSDLDGQKQTTPILTIIGDQDNYALGDDLIRPDKRQYSNCTNIDTKYVLIPGLGHSFPVSYMDEVGEWILAH